MFDPSNQRTAALPRHGAISIAVIGLGNVGLPVAVEFSKQYPVVGFVILQTVLTM